MPCESEETRHGYGLAMHQGTTVTDGDLVRQARVGHRSALAELVNRWAGRVFALCHTHAREPNAAADLAQETLLRGIQGLPTLASPEKFGPWLRGIAKRVCLDWHNDKTRKTLPIDLMECSVHRSSPSSNGVSDCERKESACELDAAIAALPPECREVLMIYYFQDLTYQDIATMLEVSAATVNARLTRARMLLRQRFNTPRESPR